MDSPTNSPSLRPMQRKRGRAPTKSRKSAKPTKQAGRVAKPVSKVNTKTAQRPLPLGVSRNKNTLELQLPPSFLPLTTENLQKHTQLTNPGEKPLSVMTDSETVKSVPKSEILQLRNYGVINLDEQKWPPEMEPFIKDVITRLRPEETPSADKIWKALSSAKEATSEADMANILTPLLMFSQENGSGDGEKYVWLGSDVYLNAKYVEHPTRKDLNLKQPKPDRLNGYVSNKKTHAGVLKPAFSMEEELTIGDMVEPIHDDILFPWFSAEFKKYSGRSLAWAILQNQRAGVAAVNLYRAFFAKAGVEVEQKDTAHFTIACDTEIVVLYIHWYNGSGIHYTKRFFKADLGGYGPWGGKSEQMVEIKKVFRNILEWAIEPRLSLIKHAISVFDQGPAVAPQGKGKGKATCSDSSGLKSGKAASTSSSANPKGRGRGQPPKQQQDAPPLRRSNRLQSAGK